MEGVGDSRGTFEVAGEIYNTVTITVHPQYDDFDFDLGNDISIMELSRPVPGSQPMQILRDAPYIGQTLTLVGFGEGGTTSNPIRDFGNKRVGETPIDEITDVHIIWNFDNNSESNTAPGDSGGPAFVSINGQQYIAGITSGGDSDPHRLGDRSFDTRVDMLAGWIDAVLSNANPDPVPDPDPNPNPDPNPDPNPNPDPGPGPGPDPQPNPDPQSNVELDGDVYVDEIGSDVTTINLEDGVGFVDAVVNSQDDQDIFQVTLTHSDTVYLDLFSWDGDLDTQLQVFDADGSIVSDNNDSYGSTDSSLILQLDAGIYYLMAASVDSSTGEYGLDVYVESFGNHEDWDHEEGNLEDSDDWEFGNGEFGNGEYLDGEFSDDDWSFDDGWSVDDEFDDEWIFGDDNNWNWDWNDLDDFDLDSLDDVMGQDIDWWSDAFGLL